MIGPGTAGSVMEAFAEGFATGLVGTLGVTIDDGEGNNVVPRTTADIAQIETVGAFGVYSYLGVFPALVGTYIITWDDTVVTASESIEVGDTAAGGATDPPEIGPCGSWTDEEQIAACCGVEASSDTLEGLEAAGEDASAILFELSGRQYRGVCGPVTVRPCRLGNPCYPPGRLRDPLPACGCQPLSTVLLAGYPVTEIAEVKIDGETQPPSEYRLDSRRKLVRLATTNGRYQAWPGCQRLDLADTEEQTFSVAYYYGVAPPATGVSAANQLACEIYRACTGGECSLPVGTTKVTRQGITVERGELATFLSSGQTGLVLVDAFLAAYGSASKRRPAVWSPDGPKYAKRVGV